MKKIVLACLAVLIVVGVVWADNDYTIRPYMGRWRAVAYKGAAVWAMPTNIFLVAKVWGKGDGEFYLDFKHRSGDKICSWEHIKLTPEKTALDNTILTGSWLLEDGSLEKVRLTDIGNKTIIVARETLDKDGVEKAKWFFTMKKSYRGFKPLRPKADVNKNK